MTHKELLAKIDDWIYTDGMLGLRTSGSFALRAVVELHEPMAIKFPDYNPEAFCKKCKTEYPCPTIQAIEKEL